MNASARPVSQIAETLEVEQALLGAVLHDPAAWSEHVDPAHLTEPAHRWIWEVVGGLKADGASGPVVAAILISRGADVPAFQDLGGAAYLADLIDKAPTGSAVRTLGLELGRSHLARMRVRLEGTDGPTPEHNDWLADAAARLERRWAGDDVAVLAKPFRYRDPSTLPQRDVLYEPHYIRRYLSTSVAPGGLGKTSMITAEVLAMVSGKPLLKVRPCRRLKVWLWNGEDPLEETERRVHATMIRYGLLAADVEGFLFLGSGREAEITIAEQTRDGVIVQRPQIEAIKAIVARNELDVVVIDPFVSSHRVQENDNGAIDRVAKSWAAIAEEANVAVELVHHVRKGAPGQEITVEDGRGAVALLAAARSARVLNPMTKDEAAKVDVARPRSYFRVDSGKANMAPPPDGSTWYRFVSVNLGNGDVDGGDSVGVVEPWAWPSALESVSVDHLRRVQAMIAEGEWRDSVQSPRWAGRAVAEVLQLSSERDCDKAKIKSLLRIWLASGALRKGCVRDAKGNDRPTIEVGKWVDAE